MTLLPFPAPKEAKVQGRPFMNFFIILVYYQGFPTLRAMIFRRICTPKKNNDAMHRLIFVEAQLHSESHGPMRRFMVYRVLVFLGSGSVKARNSTD
ncbi:MAG: hypothetical protein LAT83_18260 [Kiritimatiellae bacterium]|nr:hypothetical protein [Kiritimatiellia bacterium]